jgi:hypothetical protein
LAWSPKKVANWDSTAALRSEGDMELYWRALSPPTKPNTTPGEPPGGESSKVALTGPPVSSAVPLRPASRQKGRL